MGWKGFLSVYTLIAAVLPVIVLAAPLELPDLGDASQAFLSPQAERAMGEKAMGELRASGAYLNDPEVNAYLDSLGYRLVSADPSIESHFRFFAVNDPTINAFALPGGYIGVNTGLIVATQSEGELASVLAHEISHVTQHHIARTMAAQSHSQLATIATVAASVLAAKSGNAQVLPAAMAGMTAAQMQGQINFTRENELEADRIGFQLLVRAGFDPRSMAEFFQRMEKLTRTSETNMPAFLQSHPLTPERIAEAEDRAYGKPYRQVADSLDYQLVRALLRSYEGTPENAIAEAASELKDGRFSNRTAAIYGYAASLLRGRQYQKAFTEIDTLDQEGVNHPMIEALAGQILLQAGQLKKARRRYESALAIYPDHMQLVYDYPRVLMRAKQYQLAADFAESQLEKHHADATLNQLAAEANAALGKVTKLHFYQGEYYAALGNLRGASEQYALAVRANDGSFQDLSVAESRLHQLRNQLHETVQAAYGRRRNAGQSLAAP
jgi:predicted Zn-dependent protease